MWTTLSLMVVSLSAATGLGLLCLCIGRSETANPGRDARFITACCLLAGIASFGWVLWLTEHVLAALLTGVGVILFATVGGRLLNKRLPRSAADSAAAKRN